VVIVGAGFGGLTAARQLGRAPVAVTLIDRSNHHLFQPLLYQVATAGLSPADIAVPIRHVVRRQANTLVIMQDVAGVDAAGRRVFLTGGEVPYDYLLLATGARYNYFGHDGWERFAPALKSIADATGIRRKILLAFEMAELATDPRRREALLTFVIVGGGPTGVELAGAIAELARAALASDFRRIRPDMTRIVLLEASVRILSSFPETLAARAAGALRGLGVEVRTGVAVESVDEAGVVAAGGRIDAGTVLWAAGVMASPAGKWLGAETDRAGRVKVRPDLSVPDHPEVFVIGDAACCLAGDGRQLPGIAPVAMQQGRYVARLIRRRVAGAVDPGPFVYRDKGNLATVGRSFAIVDLGRVRLSGFPGWVTWLVVHIYYLIGFRNRLLVMLQWAWAYLTFQRGARLIVAPEDPVAGGCVR
jgi:NADH dehydrogenase